MKNIPLAFVDIETTGLDFDNNEIIEIAGIIVSPEAPFDVLSEFEWKVKPSHIETANPTALKINKYNEKDWSDAISLFDAMKLFAEKTKGTMMAGHNTPFDWAFLDKAFRTTGVTNTLAHYHTLDMVSVAYIKLKDAKAVDHFTLHALCEYFDIKNEREHSALSDAKATFEVYKKLMAL